MPPLRPAHSRGHQFVIRYPKASDISFSSMPAPVASGRSEAPCEPCTHWKGPPCRGAHPKRTFVIRKKGGGCDRRCGTQGCQAIETRLRYGLSLSQRGRSAWLKYRVVVGRQISRGPAGIEGSHGDGMMAFTHCREQARRAGAATDASLEIATQSADDARQRGGGIRAAATCLITNRDDDEIC
jgi:hypothetical protein